MNKMYRDQTTLYFSGVDAKNFNLSPLERRKKNTWIYVRLTNHFNCSEVFCFILFACWLPINNTKSQIVDPGISEWMWHNHLDIKRATHRIQCTMHVYEPPLKRKTFQKEAWYNETAHVHLISVECCAQNQTPGLYFTYVLLLVFLTKSFSVWWNCFN